MNNFQALPHDLQAYPQWILWRKEPDRNRPGEMTKVPYQINGEKAETINSGHWTTFDAALAMFERTGAKYSGLGFVLTPSDPFVITDLDHHPEKNITPWQEDLITLKPDVRMWLDRFKTFVERSQSGHGLHIIGRGKKPGDRCKHAKKGVEIYDSVRYFALTGNVFESFTTIRDIQPELEAFYKWVFEEEQPVKPPQKRQTAPLSYDDSTLLEKARQAKNGANFEGLWQGNLSGYGNDHSSADMALCTMLAFWTDDPAQIDRLFRQSGLMRDKWDSKRKNTTYGQITIDNALLEQTEHYTPGNGNRRQSDPPPPTDADAPGTSEAQDTKSDATAIRKEAKRLLKDGKLQDGIAYIVRGFERVKSQLRTREDVIAFIVKWSKEKDFAKVAALVDQAFATKSEPLTTLPDDLPVHLTDTGNAKRLAQLHGNTLRFCPEFNKWFTWNGKVWEQDKGQRIGLFQRAQDVVKSLYGEASRCDDPDIRKQIVQWAKKSESRDVLSSMIDLTMSQPGIAEAQEKFDAHPMLLNVKNGIIDLETGKLRPHDPALLMTHLIPINYNPQATCPRWLDFLRVVLANDDSMIAFLQRAMGYTLTGDVSEQCLFFLHGTGKNGKSTFINVLAYVLGAYRKNLRIESLLSKTHDTIPNDIAKLPGVRCVTASEIPEGRSMNESMVKDMTGNDTLTGRFMRAEEFDFIPIFKLWMCGNHKPTIRGTDEGIWRRVRLIPFDVQIAPEQRDPRLLNKLKHEAEGVLAWAVQGCLAWQKNGLQEPKRVTKATQNYREEMDTLADFFSEYTVLAEYAKCTKQALHVAYVKWAEERGEFPLKNQSFNTRIRERFQNVSEDKGTGNKPIWKGIGLLQHDHSQSDD